MPEQKKCVLCGKPIEGFGNDPWPLVSTGAWRCCNECNVEKVIPARLDLMRKGQK